MKRFSMEFAVVLLFSLLFTRESKTLAQPAAGTLVCSSITVDTTFTLSGSPYEICDTAGLKIQQGATLTIQPGVAVIFDGASYPFAVEGTLNSLGTAAQPVLITAKTPAAGSWRGLLVAGTGVVPAALNLDYTTIQYGGAFTTAEIYADLASVSINHSQIQSSIKNGLELTTNASFTVQNTGFTGNAQDAMTVHEPKTDLAVHGLTASGNGQNAVHIAGLNTQMHGQRDWANPGLPYVIDGAVNNAFGDVLTIEPGSELRFNAGSLNIAGKLLAQGSQAEPIVLTATNPVPGSWVGLSGNGGTAQAIVQLDYVTVEYGGSSVGGADVNIVNGQLVAHHSIFRSSAKDGVRINNNAGGSVIDGQIYGNALYGVRNTVPAHGVLASNNWWGDSGGPASDVAACPSGLGDMVTAGVFYLPVAASANAASPFPLSAMPAITLTPRRWFTPADGVTRDYMDITLTNGNGAPIPGRTVKLSSTLGTVVDGGITDANGKALAYLTSNGAVGDAQVSATLDATTGCEGVISPVSAVTFTAPVVITDLLPNAPAPYFAGDITVSPMPVVTGVQTTIFAKLTNPLAAPVTVDVEFAFAQSGIGLAFGPIKDIVGQVIPGNSSVALSAQFVPVVSGHYCVQVAYTITAVGGVPQIAPQASRQLKQFNLNVQQASGGSPAKGDGLAKTRKSLKLVNGFVDKAYRPNPAAVPLAVANAGIEWDLNNAEKISNALQGDPPRQDYTLISVPVIKMLPPVQAGPGLSPARAAALNDLDSALAEANADGAAAAIALDRSGGAVQAADLQWASTQNGVMLEYERQMGVALVNAAAKIDNVLNVAISEGQASLVITPEEVIAMQQTLQGGFSAEEIVDAHTIGLSDADIEAFRQEILAAKPTDLAGDVFAAMRGIRDQFASLGIVLQNPYVFYPPLVVAGDAPLQPQAAGNTMAQVYNSVMSFPLANPGTATALITLKTRRIDLPADWTVDVTPTQVSLAAGAQATITVTVGAGSPTRQGTVPRVAVEAYDGATLLGGVTFDIMVPRYAPFDGTLRTYLPGVQR